jgi:hypothetical protein
LNAASRESLLEHRASEAPDAPFLFFRGARHDFEWISFGDAAAHRKGTLRRPRELPSTVESLLDRAASVSPEGAAPLPRGAGREVWVSWRILTDPAEARLAGWALGAGASIVVETHERLPVSLVAWARPTLVSASADDLERLFAHLEAEAPGWRRRQWLGQRLGRLRRILVESEAAAGPPDSDGPSDLIVRLRATAERLHAGAGAGVQRFEAAPMSPLV